MRRQFSEMMVSSPSPEPGPARQKVERIVARLAREPEGQDGEIGQQDRNDPVIAIEEHLN